MKRIIEKIDLWLKSHGLSIRLLLAVGAGIAVAKILPLAVHEVLHKLGIFPDLTDAMFDPDLLITALIVHSISAIFGAIVTAWLARDQAKRAAFILGSKEAIVWLIGIILL